MVLNKDIYNLSKLFRKGVNSYVLNNNLITINIKKEYLRLLVKFLKNHYNTRMLQLLDIWGVDFPGKKYRFEVNYLLLSLKYNFRILIKVGVKEDDSLESISDIFSSAGWLEREVWDMFGVYFSGHKDLRRILTDYGFEGFPLRKDFPLSGFVEVRYDDGEKRVVLEPIEITQEFRYFHFLSPWEHKKN